MHQWSDFAVAIAGAAAALTGLIFVGISLNLKTIMEYPALVNRAFVSLMLLLCILKAGVLLLVPQGPSAFGWEIIIIASLVWPIVTRIDVKNYRKTQREYKREFLQAAFFDQCALSPYLVSGILILANGENGFYWLVPSIVIPFIKAVFDTWVLLIEVNRLGKRSG